MTRKYDPARDLAFANWREAIGWARVKARQTTRRYAVRRARPGDEVGGRHATGDAWIIQALNELVRLP